MPTIGILNCFQVYTGWTVCEHMPTAYAVQTFTAEIWRDGQIDHLPVKTGILPKAQGNKVKPAQSNVIVMLITTWSVASQSWNLIKNVAEM